MEKSVLYEKALDFGAEVVKMYEKVLLQKGEVTVVKMLLCSATNIGLCVNEAVCLNNKTEFVAKLHIALKHCFESLYWLEIVDRVEYKVENLKKLVEDGTELKTLLMSTINTTKKPIKLIVDV